MRALESPPFRAALPTHWRAAWVGLDTAEAIVFLLTAWFFFRGSVRVAITASMAAAIMWVDAWFNVLTSVARYKIATAANLAVFVEIPLGVFCLYVPLRTMRALRFVSDPGPDRDQ